jgi:MFS family permease
MKKESKTIIWITLLIALLICGVFVGNIYFNIPMGAFPPILTLLSLILVGIDRLFFKRKREPIPEPTKENKLRGTLAAYAGVSLLAIIMGIAIGFNVLSYLEKKGRPLSGYEVLAVLFGVPIVVFVFYLKKRRSILKKYA